METKSIKIGNLIIGSGFPVAIQTMWKSPLTEDIQPVLNELKELSEVGADIVRFAVPDIQDASILSNISKKSIIPIVADIHFDYKIALKCIEGGVHKIRINPGNIGSSWKVEEVVRAALDMSIPIRVGVNGGSLPASLRDRADLSQAMVEAAEIELNIFEKLNFKDVVFSLKSSDIDSTVMANQMFSKKYSYPLHLGVTEAGPLIPGIVKSSIALNSMIRAGIGDTIRVSLSDSMKNEVLAAREILKSSGLKSQGVNIISCPRCGRASFNTHDFLLSIESSLQKIKKNISIAVMGCIVNGPGEARHADLGITGSGDNVVIFKKGKVVSKGDSSKAVEMFIRELEEF
ncbi:MAG: flavodoxin-dependent (E)-4-hydroxy-3-methylbut-2-enyl-diphosphate synthase [Spirochaetia bacterium]|jgi:(E)-4-hydroxy-3-methylbut-2-enyl-diphosphate synthase|nr:flavodoxin-dependent (E)-4-hydroxy-3-methylbut-2-enyl-diphosphate synthase [Spirochaetia bacterium]